MSARSSRALFFALVAFLLVLPIAPFSVASAATSPANTGVIIPLYSYPGSAWNGILQARAAYPSVPIVAVVNPGSGPGGAPDQNYLSWISKLESAGVTVIGYVYTSYAARSLSSVEADMSTYQRWYHVDGIFFDQMSNLPVEQSYYATLGTYAKSLGFSFTVGNPGTGVPSSYVGTLNCILIYENSGAPSLSRLATVTMGLGKSNFAFAAYASALTSSYVSSASAYVGFMYLTNGVMPSPYSSLPSYFLTLESDLNAPSTTASVTVQSVSGTAALTGMWTVIKSDGNTVVSGFTPLAFSGEIGQAYTVQVSNYGSNIFQHWNDGSTSPVQTFTLTAQTTLTAYFGAPAEDLINVQSITTSGATLTGMKTVVQSDGVTIASGFTPFNFYGQQGAQYTVIVSSYGANTFAHWDNWSTNPARTVVLSQNTWLTASYSG
jgi:hypothetical protein